MHNDRAWAFDSLVSIEKIDLVVILNPISQARLPILFSLFSSSISKQYEKTMKKVKQLNDNRDRHILQAQIYRCLYLSAIKLYRNKQ